jgi:hypothetical protein
VQIGVGAAVRFLTARHDLRGRVRAAIVDYENLYDARL